MIVHLVLFTPRADLSPEAKRQLATSFEAALKQIPSIRRARVGKRILHGRVYEELMTVNYEYAAVLEFDDEAGLKAYLQHPAHEQLGAQFYEMFEQALMYDFDLAEGAAALAEIKQESG
jgi:hypothetical protein